MATKVCHRAQVIYVKEATNNLLAADRQACKAMAAVALVVLNSRSRPIEGVDR